MKKIQIICWFLLCSPHITQAQLLSALGPGLEGTPFMCFGDSVTNAVYAVGAIYEKGDPLGIDPMYGHGVMEWKNNAWHYFLDNDTEGLSTHYTDYVRFKGDLYIGGGIGLNDNATGRATDFMKLDESNHKWEAIYPYDTAWFGGVNALCLSEDGNTMYIGGNFYDSDGYNWGSFLAYDGSNFWSPITEGIPGGVNVPLIYAMKHYKNELYVGGNFSSTNPAFADMARWDGSAWHSLGGGNANAATGGVDDMLVYQGKLILGGSFTLADSPYVSRLAAWDGSTWSAFDSYPPFDGAARALATDGDNLYVSWQGYDAGTGAYDHAYKYDGQTWTRIAYARGGHITSVASFNGEVYIGGGFTSVNDIPFYGIAKYGFATGLTDPFQPQQKLSLFPNPSQGRLHCQLPEAWQGLACSISLQDISGKSVLNLEYDGHTDIVLSVSALPTGIYTLSATTPQGTIHQKWVKE